MRIRSAQRAFDSDAPQLTLAGGVVGRSPRALELLAILLAHRSRNLPQAGLRDQLWPDTVVSSTSVSSIGRRAIEVSARRVLRRPRWSG
jgi:DNA-binding winged helix-turn-helix (wHTH) protein